jgi:DNA-binding SARP family transcriptional activator
VDHVARSRHVPSLAPRRSGSVTATVTPARYVAIVSSLTISLLGQPQIEVDGSPLEVDTRKAVALLAYLAVTGRPARRELLADLLWPEYEPGNARAALRRTLSVLRAALGGRWLSTSRETVSLAGEGLELDIDRFRRLLADERADEAVALYRGDFLEGFGLRDSAEFDHWQVGEGQALRRELGGGLEQVALERAASGDLEAAIVYARRRLELDPLAESGHRLLIRLYAWVGDRSAAIEQYRACVRALHRELGVAPLAETTELYEQVSAGRLVPPPAAAAPAPVSLQPHRPLPFVGRDRELGSLASGWRSAAPEGRLLVVVGEAGIGKTRLLDELVGQAGAEGAASVVVRAAEAEGELPYAVVLEALRQAAARPDAAREVAELPAGLVADVSRLVPELAELRPGLPPLPPTDSPGASSRFVRSVAVLLAACCAGAEPGLLVVDDAQWVDAASLEVLGYMARRLREWPICIVLAWRGDEVSSGHALRELLADARRSGIAQLVSLERLDRAAVSELARAASAESAADRLFTQTAGLPLFVVEYLADLGADGGSDVPESVAELLRARATDVSEGARQVLAAAAVLGSPFDFDTLRDTSGRSEEEIVTALEELESRGLLGEDGEGYAFAHDSMRSVVYGDTSLARRRVLHRRAAESLAARSPRERTERAAVVAEHYRLAGRDPDAAEFHRLAGERARELMALSEAISHFEAALALSHPDEAALHEAVGQALTVAGDYAGALASLEAAAALTADRAQLGRIEYELGTVRHRSGEWELAAARYEAAAAAFEADPGMLARVQADRSLNEHRRGRTEDAAALARSALHLAEQAADTAALAQAHNILGILAASLGAPAEARVELHHSLDYARALGDGNATVAALNNLALLERADGDLSRAVELTREALALCTAQGDRHREAALRNNLADLLHASGEAEEAMEELKRAVAIFAEIGGEPGEAPAEIWKLVQW